MACLRLKNCETPPFLLTLGLLTKHFCIATSEFKIRLKQARAQKGLSQNELAKRISVHVTNISRYERGENMPTSEVLGKLASALDTTTDFLMGATPGEIKESGISDEELLSLFKQVEKFPDGKKQMIKEFLSAFIITTNLRQQLIH